MFAPFLFLARLAKCICAPSDSHVASNRLQTKAATIASDLERPEEPRSPRKPRGKASHWQNDQKTVSAANFERCVFTQQSAANLEDRDGTLIAAAEVPLNTHVESSNRRAKVNLLEREGTEEFDAVGQLPRGSRISADQDKLSVAQFDSSTYGGIEGTEGPVIVQADAAHNLRDSEDTMKIAKAKRMAAAEIEILRILAFQEHNFPTELSWALSVLNIQNTAEANSAFRFIMLKIHPDKAGELSGIRAAISQVDRAKNICNKPPAPKPPASKPPGPKPHAPKSAAPKTSAPKPPATSAQDTTKPPAPSQTTQSPFHHKSPHAARGNKRTKPGGATSNSPHVSWRLGKNGLVIF